jgi:hypothetical protein
MTQGTDATTDQTPQRRYRYTAKTYTPELRATPKEPRLARWERPSEDRWPSFFPPPVDSSSAD